MPGTPSLSPPVLEVQAPCWPPSTCVLSRGQPLGMVTYTGSDPGRARGLWAVERWGCPAGHRDWREDPKSSPLLRVVEKDPESAQG